MKFMFSGFYNMLSLVLGLAIFFYLIAEVGAARFFELIRQMSLPFLALALFVYGISWVFRTWRLKMLTDVFQLKLPLFDTFKIHISSFAINSILPAKAGDMAMAIILKGKGLKIGTAAAVVFQTRILDVMGLLCLLGPSLFLLKSNGALPIAVVVNTSLLVIIPILLVHFDQKRKLSGLLEALEQRVSHKFAKLAALKTKDAYEAYHVIVFDKSLLILTILHSVGLWLADGLVAWLIAFSLGISHYPWVFVVGVIMANVAKSFPLTPGGMGIYEGVLTTTLVVFGVPMEAAVVIAICDHFLKKLFNLVWGLSFLPDLNITNLSYISNNKDAQAPAGGN